MVRAKFQVSEVTAFRHTAQKRVRLEAVCADEVEENRRYHRYTPHGELSITIDNPPAADVFKPGDYFYLDFTPAPEPEKE
jgi:hypothetical protein